MTPDMSEHEHLEAHIKREAFLLRTIPSVIGKVIFLLFSLYWMFRVFYINASYVFLLNGLFFLGLSVWLIISPVVSFHAAHYLISSEHLEVRLLLKKKRIPLHAIKEIAVHRGWLDRKFHTAKIEITYDEKGKNDAYEEYLDLWGVRNYEEFAEHLKRHLKR